VTIDDIAMTKVTAKPIPIADSVFLETPINGHSPRNWVRMKLLIKTNVIKIAIYDMSG
jgi:hypothetical protein